MADNDQDPIDLDTLSDEEFMKLDPKTLQPFPSPEGDSNDPTKTDADQSSTDNSEGSSGSEDTSQGQKTDETEETKTSESSAQPFKTGSNQENPEAKPDLSATQGKPKVESEAKLQIGKESGKESPKEEAPAATNQEAILDFYKKITAPFKADGRELQVRTPEDAIRLMQMGVNYSKRMEEMKPIRAVNEMLKAQGLNDPEKLNFMIDVMKGKPEAIQKLLKDNKIDPIDIDTTKDAAYKPGNHQVDPKTLSFKDAIEATMASEGGPDLIRDINSSWDDESKEALREQPAIFQNLLDQKRSGVYGKIKDELNYQRTMGYLTNVPFVQAYHQVGEAMQKAGVFGPNLTPKPKTTPSQSQQPLDTGTRKAVTTQVAPTPNLSSTQQPRVVPPNGGNQNSQPDYSAMSDEDFLKLKPPA